MSTKPIAVYAGLTENSPAPGIAVLKNAGWEVRIAESADPDEVTEVAEHAEALLSAAEYVSGELIERLPRLRIVATSSVGVDMIDLAACKQHDVVVANVPTASTEEVATHAFALTLALLRGLPTFDRDMQFGVWNPGAAGGLSRPSTLTLGILGLGRIGRTLAQLATPMFGRIVGYDPADFDTPGIERVDLETLLRSSNVISIHLPLSEATHHLIDAERLAMLPEGACIVNVARGPLIDEAALLHALESGTLGGAGLDVFEVEPAQSDNPLLAHPKVLATPHVAYRSPDAAIDYKVHQASNVVAFARDGKPISPVPLPL